ncbi:MAG TPA: Gfo/Idh/MocA family oxidoreductase [Spirochaetia bacterium]|nr:Gfo/Idh/MocA family oxidoreductase [Spirochaetia bacterium]
MSTTRIGIIGVGQIGKIHLRKYQEIPGVEVVAACDIDAAELQKVSEEFQIPHIYSNYRELLRREDIVAVEVCLHNNLHMPLTVAALEADKHVYCEKPIAGSYLDGKVMVERATACGRMLHIQLATLYSKETKAARILIEGGQLGRIYHARSTGYRRRRRPFVDGYGTKSFVQKRIAAGGALLDMGIYHIARMLSNRLARGRKDQRQDLPGDGYRPQTPRRERLRCGGAGDRAGPIQRGYNHGHQRELGDPSEPVRRQ